LKNLNFFLILNSADIPLNQSSDETNSDSIVIVSLKISKDLLTESLAKYLPSLEQYKSADASFEKEGGIIPLADKSVKRLIYSPVGPINRDYDDVRRFSEAALKGVKRALKAGAKRPIVALPSSSGSQEKYSFYDAATILGAYEAIYVVIILSFI
jgi:leucyl aminopeptidase